MNLLIKIYQLILLYLTVTLETHLCNIPEVCDDTDRPVGEQERRMMSGYSGEA